ncbi:MAG: hypothetical protein PHS12_00555 [Candidatus Omnitrophica bacterium]|nr:hypothetical protein [Candidatus Omnitrophota bacterium]MDD4981241.1 hypothetical protein [Candidatus Omnitrophota bacterium]MDD5664750.1 hypothetical protein [Candidatus Omnitrophota bacterium]
MIKLNIKRIIAKEALVILGITVCLYILIHFFLQNVPIALPRYKLDFANGETHSLDIIPQIRSYSDYRQFLETAYNPPPKVVEKRVKEFVKVLNIRSQLRGTRLINSRQVYFSRLYSRFIGVGFIVKLIFVYLFLLLIRFMVWALRVLLRPSL